MSRVSRLRSRSLIALLGVQVVASTAIAAPYRPQPPPSEPLKLDPDAMTCTPAVISGAFAQHLRPWADQPAAVLDKLRQLQASMTLATIERCRSQGRLSSEQAAALMQELGLASPPAQPSLRP